jgi:hypothetical protein
MQPETRLLLMEAIRRWLAVGRAELRRLRAVAETQRDPDAPLN